MNKSDIQARCIHVLEQLEGRMAATPHPRPRVRRVLLTSILETIGLLLHELEDLGWMEPDEPAPPAPKPRKLWNPQEGDPK